MNKWKQNIEDGNYTQHEQPSFCHLTSKGPQATLHTRLPVPLELQDQGSHMGSGPAWTLVLVIFWVSSLGFAPKCSLNSKSKFGPWAVRSQVPSTLPLRQVSCPGPVLHRWPVGFHFPSCRCPFYVGSGNLYLGFLCLRGKHFTNWVMSPAHSIAMVLLDEE